MFTQTWKKYLPVIAILMKRSVSSEQTLDMNHTDFERAAGGRKIKFSFNNLQLNDGRMDNTVKHTPHVKEFAQLLQENELTRSLLRKQRFEFTFNSDFQLIIKNNSEPATNVPPEDSNESVTESAEINE